MIIDLRSPGLFIMDKLNRIIFEMKMKGYNINKVIRTSLLAMIFFLTNEEKVMAFDVNMAALDLKQDMIYSIIFALCNTTNQITINELSIMKLFITYKKDEI